MLLLLLACIDPHSGPVSPFEGDARPRNPDHFRVFQVPYDEARDLAVSTGTPGMADFAFHSWLQPSGTIAVSEGSAGETHFELELEGLVPGGFYTAWLVRVAGSSRGDKRDLALGVPFTGPRGTSDGTNAVLADEAGRATHTVELAADATDAVGSTYRSIEHWDEIHIAFHADNQAYGHSPGPNHFTQVVVPLRPLAGSANVALSPADVDVVALLDAAGAVDYSPQDFEAATGTVTIDHVDQQTAMHTNLLLTANGLLPGAVYTAWWAEGDRLCPAGQVAGSNLLTADGAGEGSLQVVAIPTSPCSTGAFEGVEHWSAIELRLHPDGWPYGLDPGDAEPHLVASLPGSVSPP